MPRLLAALKHPDPAVRRGAAATLGRVAHGKEVETALAARLRDPDPLVREAAYEAIRQAELEAERRSAWLEEEGVD
jgi:HEAT repeat protein